MGDAAVAGSLPVALSASWESISLRAKRKGLCFVSHPGLALSARLAGYRDRPPLGRELRAGRIVQRQ